MKLSTRHVYLISAFVYLIAAYFSKGNHHPDELFQIFEFAGYKLDMCYESDLPWEFHNQMRPALQPMMVIWVHQALSLFGEVNPFFVAFLLRLLSAALSFLSVHLLIRLVKPDIEGELSRYWFVVLSFLLWIILYHNVRFSSENLSGNLFLIGYCLILLRSEPSLLRYGLVGFLFGVGFFVRFHIGFLVLGLGFWMLFIRKDAFWKIVWMALFFFVAVGLNILIDAHYYGEWTLSMYNYIEQNLLLDKVSGFGVSPWYYYITDTVLDGIPPFSLLYVVATIFFLIKRPKHPLTWALIPFLLIHFVIGHKELRFLFPILAFVPMMMAYFLDWADVRWGGDQVQDKLWTWFKKGFWVTNLILVMVVAIRPANLRFPMFKKAYREIKEPAILYYKKFPLYGDGNPNRFFRPKQLEEWPLEFINNPQPQDKGKKAYAVVHSLQEVEALGDYRVVAQSMPRWLLRFNIFNWQERTTFYYIVALDDE